MKPPGAAEAIDWARALALLGADEVDGDGARETLGWVGEEPRGPARAEAALAR